MYIRMYVERENAEYNLLLLFLFYTPAVHVQLVSSAFQEECCIPYVTQYNTPPGPIIKARLLHIRINVDIKQGVVGGSRRQLSENVPVGIGIVLGAE